MDNLLAGIAEKVCDDIGLPRPAWTRRVHSLKDRWLGSGIPRMQADAIAATTFESVVESLLAQLLSAADGLSDTSSQTGETYQRVKRHWSGGQVCDYLVRYSTVTPTRRAFAPGCSATPLPRTV